MNKIRYGIGFCVVVLLMAFTVNAHEYWPLVDGGIYEFTGPEGGATVTVTAFGDRYMMGFNSELGDSAGLILTDDSEGHLLLHDWSDYPAGSIHPILSQLRSAHILLDTSLSPGHAWVSFATVGALNIDSVLMASVVSESELDLPAGSFTALEIQIHVYGLPLFPGGHFYVAPGVGVVKFGDYELSSVQLPVATETATWGEVKSLFRDAAR